MILGSLDRVTETGQVEGWCWSPAQSEQRQVVVVKIDGVEIGTIVCDRYRKDLEDHLIGDGKHSFSDQLDLGGFERGEHVASIHAVDTGNIIGNEVSFLLTALPEGRSAGGPGDGSGANIEGHIDKLTDEGLVVGWCCDHNYPDHPVLIAIEVDGEIVGTTLAGLHRHDLTHLGSGAGRHGFRFVVPWATLRGRGAASIRVLDADTGTPISDPKIIKRRSVNTIAERIEGLERANRALRLQVEALAARHAAQPDVSLIFRTIADFFNRFAQTVAETGSPLAALEPAASQRVLDAEFDRFDLEIPSDFRVLILIDGRTTLRGLYECLKALGTAEVGRSSLVAVVDDGTNADVAAITSLVGGISYHRPRSTETLVGAIDRLITATAADYVVFLSPHARVAPNWFDVIDGRMTGKDKPRAVASRVELGNGSIATVELALGTAGEIQEIGRWAAKEDTTYLDRRLIQASPGLALAVAKVPELRLHPEIGHLPAALFDLGLRLSGAGKSISYEPAARVAFDSAAEAQFASATDYEDIEGAMGRVRDRWLETTSAAA